MPKQKKQTYLLWYVTAQNLLLRINIVTQASNTPYNTNQKSGMNISPRSFDFVSCPLSFVLCCL